MTKRVTNRVVAGAEAAPLAGGDIERFAEVLKALANPARLGYVVLVLLMNAFAAYRIPEVGKTRENPTSSVPRQHLVVSLLKILSLSLVLVGPFCDRHDIGVLPDQQTVRWVGLTLYLIGFMAMHLAEAQLGRHFSVEVAVQRDHRLVTDGLYRHVRHPRYSGESTTKKVSCIGSSVPSGKHIVRDHGASFHLSSDSSWGFPATPGRGHLK